MGSVQYHPGPLFQHGREVLRAIRADADTYGNLNSRCNSYANCHGYAYDDCNPNTYVIGDAHGYAKSNINAKTWPDAAVSTNAAAASVALLLESRPVLRAWSAISLPRRLCPRASADHLGGTRVACEEMPEHLPATISNTKPGCPVRLAIVGVFCVLTHHPTVNSTVVLLSRSAFLVLRLE